MEYRIISERSFKTWPSYHVVFEWENDFKNNGFQLINATNNVIDKLSRKISEKKNTVYFKTSDKQINLRWIMNAKQYRQYTVSSAVPIFLDFPTNMVKDIAEATKTLPLYFVTCYDIYVLLKNAGSKRVYYMPLSISDKYRDFPQREKSIDVIQFGRKNDVLHGYMMQYCKENPNTEYVYQSGNGTLEYISTTRGNIGKFDGREDYMNLMASCRVSLVSTPGVDKSRDFGGIDFFTPRFYESAAMYCHMLGRYTENEEAEIIDIKDVCPDISSYEQFKDCINGYLKSDSYDWSVEKNWLEGQFTSKRIQYVRGVIDNQYSSQ